jgi:hypothetical protein
MRLTEKRLSITLNSEKPNYLKSHTPPQIVVSNADQIKWASNKNI